MNAETTKKPVLRILHIFTALGVGGAETWLIAMLKHIKDNSQLLPYQIQMDIVLTGGFRSVLDDEAISLGAQLYYLPYTRRNASQFCLGLRKLLKKGKYDAIHSHQDYTAGWHFLLGAGYLPQIRVVHVHNPLLHIQNYGATPLRRATLKIGKELVRLFATHILGTSKQILGEYGFFESRFNKISVGAAHCGFDVSRFSGDYLANHNSICNEFGWESSTKIVLFVGRLSTLQKNPEFALNVAKHCLTTSRSLGFIFAGAGEIERLRFEAITEEWGMSSRIRFIGERSDIPRLMTGSDLLLFPSISEGLGMVAVEAQSAGLPVLASDSVPKECSVVPSMIEFLSLKDGTAIWSEAIHRILDRRRVSTAECSLAVRSSGFSIDQSLAKLIQIYTSKNVRETAKT
jgi:glycosyltransferase EpsF